jgi:hypothetical protein
VAGYAESIQTVFLVAVPIAALAFLVTWLIPQVELKQWGGAAKEAPSGEGTAMAGVAAASAPSPAALSTQEALATQETLSTQEALATRETLNPQDANRTDPRP